MLHTVREQWDTPIFFCVFPLSNIQTNEYIYEGINGTIVFPIDDCLVMKNENKNQSI